MQKENEIDYLNVILLTSLAVGGTAFIWWGSTSILHLLKTTGTGFNPLFQMAAIIIGCVLLAFSLPKKIVNFVIKFIAIIIFLLGLYFLWPLTGSYFILGTLGIISAVGFWKMKNWGLYPFTIFAGLISAFLSFGIYIDLASEHSGYMLVDFSGFSIIFIPPLGILIFLLVYLWRAREEFE